MKDYKAIFDRIESTLFKIGSRNVSVDRIQADLEPYKQLEGKRFTDDECYTLLVHIVFYSGFRAETVTEKLEVIDRHIPNYRVVADYGDGELEAILDDLKMIRNRAKIQACIDNAKTFRRIIREHGSFQAYVDSLPPARSDREVLNLRDNFQGLFKFLGERTAFHFMTDLGLPVLKPDRVIERIFKRLGLVGNDLKGDALYTALIREGRNFAEATGNPIRYIDIVFVGYGQVQTKEIGLERGVCLETSPLCSVCGVNKYCGHYANSHRAACA